MSPVTPDDPRVDPGSLVICGRCYRLRGPVPDPRVAVGSKQLCECTPVEVRRTKPRWGGDHNTYAELCRCCGLVLLGSGSRWSVWFCSTCKPLVVALNQAVGRCVIPIGRHSLMNAVAPPTAPLEGEVGIERFVEDTLGMVARIDGLDRYTAAVVRGNLEELGFEPETDVNLGKYLRTAQRSTLTAQDGFAALVLHATSPQEEER